MLCNALNIICNVQSTSVCERLEDRKLNQMTNFTRKLHHLFKIFNYKENYYKSNYT